MELWQIIVSCLVQPIKHDKPVKILQSPFVMHEEEELLLHFHKNCSSNWVWQASWWWNPQSWGQEVTMWRT